MGSFSVADAYLYTVSRWGQFVGVDTPRACRTCKPSNSAWKHAPGVQAALKAEGLIKSRRQPPGSPARAGPISATFAKGRAFFHGAPPPTTFHVKRQPHRPAIGAAQKRALVDASVLHVLRNGGTLCGLSLV